MGALRVSVADSAHARTPPSAGVTVPFMEPTFKWVKANRHATIIVVAMSLSTVNSINVDLMSEQCFYVIGDGFQCLFYKDCAINDMLTREKRRTPGENILQGFIVGQA